MGLGVGVQVAKACTLPQRLLNEYSFGGVNFPPESCYFRAVQPVKVSGSFTV